MNNKAPAYQIPSLKKSLINRNECKNLIYINPLCKTPVPYPSKSIEFLDITMLQLSTLIFWIFDINDGDKMVTKSFYFNFDDMVTDVDISDY